MNIINGMLMSLGLLLVFSFFTMFLWNDLMPVIFKLPEIDFWQSVGLNLLLGFLFKDSGGVVLTFDNKK